MSVPKVAERFERAQGSFPHVDSMELMAASEDLDLSPVALVLPHRGGRIKRAMPLPREGKLTRDESIKLTMGRDETEDGLPHVKQVDSMIDVAKRISFEVAGGGTKAAKGEGDEDCRDASLPLHLQRRNYHHDSDSDCYHGEDEEEEDVNTKKPKQLKHVNSMLLISDRLASSESEPGEECANFGEDFGVRFACEEKLPCKTNKWDHSLDSAFDVRPERVLGGSYKSLGSCSLPHVDSCEMLSMMAAGLDTDDDCPRRYQQKYVCRYVNAGDTRG